MYGILIKRGDFMKLPLAVNKILAHLNRAGFSAYAVGGCVRDLLRGVTPDDYDIATSATPDEVKALFCDYHVIETGIQHGTVTVVYDGVPYEITTFRSESTYSDARHPDAVLFTKRIEDDLSRRDFTVNAMALSKEGSLVDIYSGQKDIQNRVLRCVGDPYERFSEDALRILRLMRFASVLDFTIDPETEAAARVLAPSLSKVSVERIAQELNKLVLGKGVFRILTEYVDILAVAIPELLPMKNFDQHNYHHCYDILTHTAKAVECVAPKKHLRLAALLHDIGKPSTFSLDENGVGHFYSHASLSRDLAEEILTRLKYDNKTKDTVSRLVKWHDTVIEASEKSVKRALSKMTLDFFFDLVALKRADNLAQHPDFHTRQAYYDELETLARGILARQDCLSLADLAIKGGDLISLGVPFGKEVGRLLNLALLEVLQNRILNEREQLLEFVKKNIYTEV